jgi:LCP family protein required for cell wall assembly
MKKSFDSASQKNPLPNLPTSPTSFRPKTSPVLPTPTQPQPTAKPPTKPQPPVTIDLLALNPKTRKSKKFLLGLLLVFLLGVGLWTFNRASTLSEKIFTGQTTTIFGKVWEALRGATGNLKLQGENQGQINILLLGIGGSGHEGPFLTDSMLLVQIKPQSSEVAFVSIPRDWLTSLPNNLGDKKINSVFAEGMARTKNYDTAGKWARQAVERMSGLTIPYFAVIDFTGFAKAIDEIGGVDIQIDNSFSDSQFPDDKLGWLPTQSFEKGTEHMDGKRALIFARSRHGNNNEGSDFARSLRQQKVIFAFKNKILNKNLLTNPGKINNLLGILSDHFHTNLNPGEIYHLYELVKNQNMQNFLSLNLGLETGLVCPEIQAETGAYILIPCPGKTLDDIRAYFKNSFLFGKLNAEKSRVWLANSTTDEKKFKQAERTLLENNFTVWQLNYSPDFLSQTIVFSVNPKPASLAFIKNTLSAKEVSLPPPGVKLDPEKVDIIIILGN